MAQQKIQEWMKINRNKQQHSVASEPTVGTRKPRTHASSLARKQRYVLKK